MIVIAALLEVGDIFTMGTVQYRVRYIDSEYVYYSSKSYNGMAGGAINGNRIGINSKQKLKILSHGTALPFLKINPEGTSGNDSEDSAPASGGRDVL
jgi:hypothetical protein